MTKEQAIEKIATKLYWQGHQGQDWSMEVPTTKEWYIKIANMVYEAGYRLIPELKVLSDEEVLIAVCADCPFEGRFSDEDCHACQRNLKGATQAQLDSINKQLGVK